MVDFNKRLGKRSPTKILDPVEIFGSLEYAADVSEPRRPQVAIWSEWHRKRRDERDVILKLHTGQGKTLIGLLILQSKLNESVGPAVYLCPNNFLVNQTMDQARRFGVKVVTPKPWSKGEPSELPEDFLESRHILVTSVQMLFNGLTRFGLGPKSVPVGALVLDDAHACVDAIKDACVIKLTREKTGAYGEILGLFEEQLRNQGEGTFTDIKKRHDQGAYLPIPYWDWTEKKTEVTEILSRHRDEAAVRFAWPLLKDAIEGCLCLASGAEIVISPYLPPLGAFGSYAKARHRIFMSATVTDDSFLVKGLGLDASTIERPLMWDEERWSGEKMVLIPSLIDESLDRGEIVKWLAAPRAKRNFGIVTLSPSAKKCLDWEKYGATIATKETIDSEVEKLRHDGTHDKALVVVNRYDGIDLPGNACRILVIDSKPFAEDLLDRYVEDRRTGSDVIVAKIARTIEQGMGRGVRGEKDSCAILLIGPDLIRTLRAPGTKEFFSEQTRTQIDIGFDVRDMAKEEIASGADAMTVLKSLINKSLGRDEAWKTFYAEQMNERVKSPGPARTTLLGVLAAEVRAEGAFLAGDVEQATAILQELIDAHVKTAGDKGWYLQEIARYRYVQSKVESNKMQIVAHGQNRSLLRPKEGMVVSKLVAPMSQKRVANIVEWLQVQGSFEVVMLRVDEMLSDLQFGVIADRFEAALESLGRVLGFASERPDKDWKEGPDNLWGLRDNEFLLLEAKSEVHPDRAEINKDETDQMNRSCAWFDRHYPGAKVKRWMLISTKKVASAAAFRDDIEVVRAGKLEKLRTNVRAFFGEFRTLDLRDVSERRVHEFLTAHKLGVDEILAAYSERPYMPQA